MTMEMTDPIKRTRSHLRRKVPFVIGIVVLIAFGWFGIRFQRARIQSQAVTEIKKLGGWVFYDCRYAEDGSLKSANPAGPSWVRRRLGADFFGRVNGVKLTETAYLEGLGDFQLVSRPCNGLTDAAILHLEPLGDLQWLALHGAPITDTGLSDLASFAELQRL